METIILIGLIVVGLLVSPLLFVLMLFLMAAILTLLDKMLDVFLIKKRKRKRK